MIPKREKTIVNPFFFFDKTTPRNGKELTLYGKDLPRSCAGHRRYGITSLWFVARVESVSPATTNTNLAFKHCYGPSDRHATYRGRKKSTGIIAFI